MHNLDDQHFVLPQVVAKYISYSLVAKELWRRKQTSPSGSALGIGSFTAIIPWHPVNNYNLMPGYNSADTMATCPIN